MYCSDKNTLYLLSLLKQHGIKNIIASPGTTNIAFVLSVQEDSWFHVFSAVDERSAAYMACGLAAETNEPVVLSCTGATASRNYIPGLTEAFYRQLPILAVTSSQHQGKIESYTPQFLDRSERMKDVVIDSIQAYLPNSVVDENILITNLNMAILHLFGEKRGPVHINLMSSGKYDFIIENLPMVRKIAIIDDVQNIIEMHSMSRICVFIGSHAPFSDEEQKAIDCFCYSHDAVVLCDQTSNFHGKYRILGNLICQQEKDFGAKEFDLVIHIGSVSGSYLPIRAKEVWRVNPDGVVRDLFGTLTKVFKMTEMAFFTHYLGQKNSDHFLLNLKECRKKLENDIPELPFSNVWIAKQTSPKIDQGVLHFAILNSLRSWNLFEVGKGVACYSNTGGFGIDGCLSSFIGAANSDKNNEYYGIFGDLSFFYDINTLMNSLPSNLHMMVINNGIGIEFKNLSHPASRFGVKTNVYVAAQGHNGNQSKELVRGICKNLEILYISSSNKEEYLNNERYWIEKHDKPVIHEIFFFFLSEQLAMDMINHIAVDKRKRTLYMIKNSFIAKMMRRMLKRK